MFNKNKCKYIYRFSLLAFFVALFVAFLSSNLGGFIFMFTVSLLYFVFALHFAVKYSVELRDEREKVNRKAKMEVEKRYGKIYAMPEASDYTSEEG